MRGEKNPNKQETQLPLHPKLEIKTNKRPIIKKKKKKKKSQTKQNETKNSTKIPLSSFVLTSYSLALSLVS